MPRRMPESPCNAQWWWKGSCIMHKHGQLSFPFLPIFLWASWSISFLRCTLGTCNLAAPGLGSFGPVWQHKMKCGIWSSKMLVASHVAFPYLSVIFKLEVGNLCRCISARASFFSLEEASRIWMHDGTSGFGKLSRQRGNWQGRFWARSFDLAFPLSKKNWSRGN